LLSVGVVPPELAPEHEVTSVPSRHGVALDKLCSAQLPTDVSSELHVVELRQTQSGLPLKSVDEQQVAPAVGAAQLVTFAPSPRTLTPHSQ
jgi:hypothetical protein